MVIQTARTDAAAIDTYLEVVHAPENADRRFELVWGEIIEVVSNQYSSRIAANLLILIGMFIKQHKLGRVTGADGGYIVGDDRYIPDVGFISNQRQPEPSHETFNPLPPDLAIEVLSPTDNPKVMRRKVSNYLHVGTTVWLIDPETKIVEVYTPGEFAIELIEESTLDGGKVLPGFSVPVKDLFNV